MDKLWLEKIENPKSLVLAWEAPISCEDRTRWAIGELTQNEASNACFRYFRSDELALWNKGRGLSELTSCGFVGYPAFKFVAGDAWDGDAVLNAFIRRLPSARRPDYSRFLENFCLPEDTKISPYQLMSITELRSPNDGFSVIDPLSEDWGECDLVLEVVGSRHYDSATAPQRHKGEVVSLSRDADNPHDEHAVKVSLGSSTLGYINRLQAKTVACWLENRDVSANLVRVNGSPDRPRPYIFVRVRSKQGRRAA